VKQPPLIRAKFNIRLKAQYRYANLIVTAGVKATNRVPRSLIPFLTGGRLRSVGRADGGTDVDSGPGEKWEAAVPL
jgi:hypothetical protein